jgi:hypothetical protein
MASAESSSHKVRIWIDSSFTRPWSAICVCGWMASGQFQKEVETSRDAHLAQQEQRSGTKDASAKS